MADRRGFLKGLAAGLALIAAPFRAAGTAVATSFSPMSTEFIRWFGGQTASGKSVSEENALGITAAWACQRIIAESLGMIPLQMFKREGRNAVPADDHPLAEVLIGSPNRDQTSLEFRETLAAHLCGNGNAYSLVDRLGKRVTSLYPIRADRTVPMRKRGGNTKLPLREGEVFFRHGVDGGAPVDYRREEVWHIKGFGRDPVVGLSPIGNAREAIGGALAEQEFANAFFQNGGMPAGIATYPGWLKADQRAIARENLAKVIGGLGNAHKFAFFEGGMKVEPWESMNMEDMQFILSRKFSVLEICRLYRVPPHMVAELEKGASYASIEMLSQEFVMFTLMPYFTRIEASAAKWLMEPAERRTHFVRFNYEALLRADSKGRAEYLGKMVDHGLMTRNEARAKENLNESTEENMDAFTVQTALTVIDKLGEEQQPAAPAPGEPAPDQGEETPPPADRAGTFSALLVADLTKQVEGLRGELAEVRADAGKRHVEQVLAANAAAVSLIRDEIDKAGYRVPVFENGEPVGTRPATLEERLALATSTGGKK